MHDLIYCNSFRSLLHAINFLLMQNVAFDEMKFWRVDFLFYISVTKTFLKPKSRTETTFRTFSLIGQRNLADVEPKSWSINFIEEKRSKAEKPA